MNTKSRIEVEDVVRKVLCLHEYAEELSDSYLEKIRETPKTLQSFQEEAAAGFKMMHDFLYHEEISLMDQIERDKEKTLCFLEDRVMDMDEATSSVLELVDNLSKAKDADGRLADVADSQLEQLRKVLARYEKELRSYGPEVLSSAPVQYSICRQMLKSVAESALKHFTLDVNSAHPYLVISEDLKSVRLSPCHQVHPKSPLRFQPCLYVFCSEGFQSGRHYWEVSVGQKTNWVLGVASCQVNRKAVENLTPRNGYWALRKAPGNQFYALSSPPVLLAPHRSPTKVGVLLDYEKGKVGFYDAENMVKLCSIVGDFQEMVHPFLCPGLMYSEEDYHPLTIHN
ncbi:nuclear factor 7, ovary-like [Heteronotia binoei]|uniref:nuclear factor 7, ovary-like n=1 Tax=Heteronotia binoei TaxID=13085 RepID=UPI002930DB65|nr:nuclear factor 7, ovary-like [Heteronotia binoei]